MFQVVAFLFLLLLLTICWLEPVYLCYNRNDYNTTAFTPLAFRGGSDVLTGDLSTFHNSSVVICGLARNCVDALEMMIPLLERVGSLFREYCILVVENDSTDGTRERLLQWAEVNKHVRVLGCDGVNLTQCKLGLAETDDKSRFPFEPSVSQKRIKKMVDLRNVYVQYILGDERLSHYDFELVIDFDVIGFMYLDGLATTSQWFGKLPNVDAISAVGLKQTDLGCAMFWRYSDPYALEEKGNEQCSENSFFRMLSTMKYYYFLPCYNYGHLIDVSSAFGHCTMYRLPSVLGQKYEFLLDDDGIPHCEHTTLNRKLGRVTINPSWKWIIETNIG
jgi:hypothetical protein